MEERITALRREIEAARVQLDEALEQTDRIEECYELSLALDRLINQYMALCGQEKILNHPHRQAERTDRE